MPAIRAEALVPSPMATGLALLRPARARAHGRGHRAATGPVPRSLPPLPSRPTTVLADLPPFAGAAYGQLDVGVLR